MAREYETSAQGSPDWERLIESNEALYRRADNLPPSPQLPLRTRFGFWLLRMQDRRLTWSHDGASYLYDGTRSRFNSVYRWVGAVASITEIRQDSINRKADQAILSRRTIRYELGEGVGDSNLLLDRQGKHVTSAQIADNLEELRKDIHASDAVQAELNTDLPTSETYPQLIAWMEMGVSLTQFRQEQ